MHIPSLCLRSPIIIGTPSPLAAYFRSLFFHQSALQLNIEKSYVGPMSSKDEPQRRLAIVESFLRHDFTSLFNLTVRRIVRLCRNTSCGCTPALIAPDKIASASQLLQPYIHLLVATKLSFHCRRQLKHLECGPVSTGHLRGDQTTSNGCRIKKPGCQESP
jgi:hypothetical protein